MSFLKALPPLAAGVPVLSRRLGLTSAPFSCFRFQQTPFLLTFARQGFREKCTGWRLQEEGKYTEESVATKLFLAFLRL